MMTLPNPRRESLLRLSLWLNAALPIIYLIAESSALATLYGSHPLVVWGLLGATLAAFILPFRAQSALAYLRALPLWVVWLIVLLFWLMLLQIGFGLGSQMDDPQWLIPFFLWGIVDGMALIWLRGVPEQNEIENALSRRNLLILAGFFAALSIARDSFLIWAFSYRTEYDTTSYVFNRASFTDPDNPIWIRFRTVNYPFLNLILDTYDHPWRVVFLQIVLAALVVGALVYVLGKKNLVLASLVGLLLALDGNWGINNRALMTESTVISLHVLALVLLIRHYELRDRVTSWELLLSGMLYAWAFTIRPTSLLLILPVLGLYWLFTRAWLKTALVALGMALVLIGCMFLNQWRLGEFGLGGDLGLNVVYSLFPHGLFSPQNGSASAELDSALKTCFPDLNYEDITAITIRGYLWSKFYGCLTPTYPDHGSGLYVKAYREAILAHPVKFAKITLRETGNSFSFNVQNNFLGAHADRRPSVPCINLGVDYPFCDSMPSDFRIAPWRTFFSDYTKFSTSPTQLYLLMMPADANSPAAYAIPPDDLYHFGTPSRNLTALVAFLMLCGFLMIALRGEERYIALLCAGFILYTTLAFVVSNAFVPRFTAPFSPFFSLLSALTIVVIFRSFWSSFRLPQVRLVSPLLGAASVILLLASGYFIVGSQDESAYLSIIKQVEQRVAELPAVYNPAPENNLWEQPERFVSGNQEWERTLLPGYLKSDGLDFLLIDQLWWDAQSEDARAKLQNPDYYHLMQRWQDENGRAFWLYEVVGDQREAIYSSPTLQVFQQFDGQLDLYGIADGGGFFIMRVDPSHFRDEEYLWTNEAGWQVEFRLERGGYHLYLSDPAGTLVDEGFVILTPIPQPLSP